MHATWARAEQVRSCKESHQIFPTDGPAPRRIAFAPSYTKEEPSMSLLLSGEYGRQWIKEHKDHIKNEARKAKPRFVEPDFSWWVSKRAQILDRRQIFLKNKQNPHTKNCNLTAFAKSKTHRKKRGSSAMSGTSGASAPAYNGYGAGVYGSAPGPYGSSPVAYGSAPTTDASSPGHYGSAPTTDGSNPPTDGSPPSTGAGRTMVKPKKCNCKECMQRRCGGGQEVYGSYGPDNRKHFYFKRKVDSVPWY